jgi:hypothetical protein
MTDGLGIPSGSSGPLGQALGTTSGQGAQTEAGPDNQTVGSHGSHIPEGLSFESGVEAKLNRFVDEYKKGRLTKVRAIGLIAQTLPAVEQDSPSTADAALESFIRILISHEDTINQSAVRGTPDGALSGSAGLGDAGVDQSNDRPEPVPNVSLRPRRTASTFDDEDPPNLIQSLGGSNKKQRIYEADQPWYPTDVLAQSFLPPELQKTRSILLQFAGDYSAIKRWIDISASVPQFPDSEWDNVIKGRSINLDAVFTSVYSTESNTDNVEELGGLSIRFGAVKPAKTIKTHGDWVIAWGAAVDATIFCFPHRERKLRQYGFFITRLFAAISPSAHSRIINYDKAVRARVGQRNDHLLTETYKFDDLKLTWIDSVGTGVSNEESTASRQSKKLQGREKSNEPCNNFNKGECKYSSGRCNYAHTCKKCKKAGHGQNTCTAK